MKNVLGRYRKESCHWVGDGFPVRSLFSHESLGARISPFLLLDYAGPHTFAPTQRRCGIGQHPHRGFETVTIVYDGEVEHRECRKIWLLEIRTAPLEKKFKAQVATPLPVRECSNTKVR